MQFIVCSFPCVGERVAETDAEGVEVWQLWRIDGKYIQDGKLVYGVQYWEDHDGKNQLWPVKVDDLKTQYPEQVEKWERIIGTVWDTILKHNPPLWAEKSGSGSEDTENDTEDDQKGDPNVSDNDGDSSVRTPTRGRSTTVGSMDDDTQRPSNQASRNPRPVIDPESEDDGDTNEDSILTIRAPDRAEGEDLEGDDNEEADDSVIVIDNSEEGNDSETDGPRFTQGFGQITTPIGSHRSNSESGSSQSSISKRTFKDTPRKARQPGSKKPKASESTPNRRTASVASSSSDSKRGFEDTPQKDKPASPKKAKTSSGPTARKSAGALSALSSGSSRVASGIPLSVGPAVNIPSAADDPFASDSRSMSGTSANRFYRLPSGYPSMAPPAAPQSPNSDRRLGTGSPSRMTSRPRPQAYSVMRGSSPSSLLRATSELIAGPNQFIGLTSRLRVNTPLILDGEEEENKLAAADHNVSPETSRKNKGNGRAMEEDVEDEVSPEAENEEEIIIDTAWCAGAAELAYLESQRQIAELDNEDDIQPTQFRKPGGSSIYDEYSRELIGAYEAGLDHLIKVTLDLKGMPCDGWVEKRKISKACKFDEFRYTLWLMMLSWDPVILKHVVRGDIAKEEKQNRDLEKRLRILGSMSNTVVSPSTYAQYFTCPDGKSPAVKILSQILVLVQRYLRGYNINIEDDDDDELRESHELASEVDAAVRAKDHKWGLSSANRGERRYLINDNQAIKCAAWIEAAKERLVGLDPEQPLERPWSEVGFAKKPRDRLDDHLKHQGSNNLMNLVEAICKSQVGFEMYTISQFVVHKLVHHTHAMFDEILTSRFALAYTAQGGGFSHHPAGISHKGAETVESGFYHGVQRSLVSEGEFSARTDLELAKMKERGVLYLEFGKATRKRNESEDRLNEAAKTYVKRLEEVKAKEQRLILEVKNETAKAIDYLARRAARQGRLP